MKVYAFESSRNQARMTKRRDKILLCGTIFVLGDHNCNCDKKNWGIQAGQLTSEFLLLVIQLSFFKVILQLAEILGDDLQDIHWHCVDPIVERCAVSGSAAAANRRVTADSCAAARFDIGTAELSRWGVTLVARRTGI